MTIFDTRTLKRINEVPAGKKPDAIIYDPASSQVFASMGAATAPRSSALLMAKWRELSMWAAARNSPLLMAKGYVFNNLEDESQIVKINSRQRKVEQRWPTAPCSPPSSMAIDRDNRRLFVGCRSKVR